MKTQLLILLSVFATSALAQPLRKFPVVARTENNKPTVETVALVDLESADAFDGKYFKVVKGKSDEAVRFTDPKELTFRAATAYHHLTKARNYFVNRLKSDYVAKLPKIVVRIEHTNQFSELGHFAHDNMDPQYNNALTVPAGKGLERKGIRPWEIEIWFRPVKRMHLRDIQVHDFEGMEYQAIMKQFRNQIHMQSLQRFLADTIQTLMDGKNPFTVGNAVRAVGTSLILEASYQLVNPVTKALTRKWYWLDTAMVPEIVYHEFAHVALSDHLVLSHSTAIIEGMADFFAGQIADSPKLAKHIKKYNTYNGKNAKKKKSYMLQFEMTDYANTDFVFGLLWEMKKVVGEDRGEAFMYELRKKLTTNATIRNQLIEGLLETCKEKCASPFTDRLKILKALDARGI